MDMMPNLDATVQYLLCSDDACFAKQSHPGLLGTTGALEYPGETWLCVVLLWVSGAHNSFPCV